MSSAQPYDEDIFKADLILSLLWLSLLTVIAPWLLVCAKFSVPPVPRGRTCWPVPDSPPLSRGWHTWMNRAEGQLCSVPRLVYQTHVPLKWLTNIWLKIASSNFSYHFENYSTIEKSAFPNLPRFDATYLRLTLGGLVPVLRPPWSVWDGWKCKPHATACCPSLILTGPTAHSCPRWHGCSHQTVPAGRVCASRGCI